MEPAPYLSAATVATVIVDEFVGPTRARCSKAVTPELAPGAAEYTLTPLARHADGSVTAFATAIENWYDAQMGRVAGYHKRWIKRWFLVIAAAVLVFVMHVERSRWRAASATIPRCARRPSDRVTDGLRGGER